jgi:hypothetical protein
MLDVHPPHTAAHTWKDFFIHIITIVIGLLIAIGLEQTVEFFHHHHEVKETRKALAEEREENRKFFAVNTADFRVTNALLQNNLQVFLFLQQHPGTPEEKLPGVPRWAHAYEPAVESVWKNAQETQVLSLFPRQEAEADADLYRLLELLDTSERTVYSAIRSAGSYAIVDPDPSHLTPTQVAEEIELIKKAIDINYIWGVFLSNASADNPDFTPAPTDAELLLIGGRSRSDADQSKLAAARALTNARLAPFLATRAAAMKIAGDNHY